MKERQKSCKYCGKELTEGTTRKSFCSDKCRVYWNREHPKVSLKNFNKQTNEKKEESKKAAENESINTLSDIEKRFAEINKKYSSK